MGTEFQEGQGVGKRTGARPQQPLGHTLHSQPKAKLGDTLPLPR